MRPITEVEKIRRRYRAGEQLTRTDVAVLLDEAELLRRRLDEVLAAAERETLDLSDPLAVRVFAMYCAARGLEPTDPDARA